MNYAIQLLKEPLEILEFHKKVVDTATKRGYDVSKAKLSVDKKYKELKDAIQAIHHLNTTTNPPEHE